jgi:hypothetical protein
LIRNIECWINRRHGELDFYLCQFLTGHGYFGAYLHKMGKLNSPQCRYCLEERDDVCHTFFRCGRFIEDRRRLTTLVGEVTPDTIVDVILQTEPMWKALANYVGAVLRRKRDDGCLEDP